MRLLCCFEICVATKFNAMIYQFILLLTACSVRGLVSWGAWSVWTSSCPRSCSDMFGLQRRHRMCRVCKEEGECFPAVRPTSISLCTGHYEETRQCYVGLECEGPGSFTGEWSSWESFGPCMTPFPGCDVPGQQYITRTCVSSTDSESSSGVQCPLADSSHTFKLTDCVKECPVKGFVKKRDVDTKLNLFWSDWSDWKCSSPCLSPKVQAVRHRTCTEMGANSLEICASVGKNEKYYELLPCIQNNVSLCPVINSSTADASQKASLQRPNSRVKREDVDGKFCEWASWGECSTPCNAGHSKRYCVCGNPKPQGNVEQCSTDIVQYMGCEGPPCPVNGQWGAWAHYTCSVTCGEGIRYRYRNCDNPAQEGAGKPCVGTNREVTDTTCSLVGCPQHSPAVVLPENISKAVKTCLNTEWYRRDVEHFFNWARFPCYNEAKRLLLQMYPFAVTIWTMNGHPIPHTRTTEIDWQGALTVIGLKHHDQGVYMCQMNWARGMRVTITIASLVIQSNHIMYAHPGDNVELPCYGAPLGMIYKGLRQFWFKDGEVYKDYGSISPQMANVEYFKDVQPSFSGLWECIITEVNSERMWITYRVRLKVLPHTLLQKLFPDPLHFYIVVALVVVLVLAVLTCCIYQNRMSELQAEEEAKVFESLLAETGFKKNGRNENGNMVGSSHSETSVNSNEDVSLLGGGKVHRDTLPQI